MPLDARAVANFFLDLAEIDGIPVEPMKLQKLIYYAHGWSLALHGEPLISSPVQAWEYGPVVPAVYSEFKHYGGQPITSRAGQLDWETEEFFPYAIPEGASFQPERELIKSVWNAYKRFSGIELSNATHAPDGPWFRVVKPYLQGGRRIPKGLTIDDRWIEESFDKEKAEA